MRWPQRGNTGPAWPQLHLVPVIQSHRHVVKEFVVIPPLAITQIKLAYIDNMAVLITYSPLDDLNGGSVCCICQQRTEGHGR